MRHAPLSALDVVHIINTLRARGVNVCVDRGFGIDALVGEVTRSHRDLDLLVAPGELTSATTVLAELGFDVARAEDGAAAKFCNTMGHFVDVRADAAVLTPGFVSLGSLDGRVVPCVSAIHQVERRMAGRLRENDVHALSTLRTRLGVALPHGLPPLWLLRVSLSARQLARRALGRR